MKWYEEEDYINIISWSNYIHFAFYENIKTDFYRSLGGAHLKQLSLFLKDIHTVCWCKLYSPYFQIGITVNPANLAIFWKLTHETYLVLFGGQKCLTTLNCLVLSPLKPLLEMSGQNFSFFIFCVKLAQIKLSNAVLRSWIVAVA